MPEMLELLAFLVIGRFLSYKVNNVRLVYIKVDAILGYQNGIFLPWEMIQLLCDQGLFTLNKIVD